MDDKPTEEDKLKRWGDEGVMLLLADSTNAESEGSTPSERTVEEMLDKVFGDAKGRASAGHLRLQHRCSRSSTWRASTTAASASSAAPWSTTYASPSSSATWTSPRTSC
ncbi:MAG: hypothetical protein R2854_25180 [Caldilineaceae bacterium]